MREMRMYKWRCECGYDDSKVYYRLKYAKMAFDEHFKNTHHFSQSGYEATFTPLERLEEHGSTQRHKTC
jgi:hypothetical protein